MHASTRLVRTTLLVVAVLVAAAAQASAEYIEILTADRGFTAVWRPLEFVAAGSTVRCNVTLEGSFEAFANEKVSGTRIGAVTRAGLGECAGGSATVLTGTIPWDLRYDSFTGTLPEISTIRLQLVGAAFQINNGLATCLARTEASTPGFAIGATSREGGGLLTMATLRADETSSIPLTGGFACSLVRGSLAGTASTTVLEEAGAIQVRQVANAPTVTFTPGNVNILAGQQIAEQPFTIRNTTAAGGAAIRIRSIGLSDAVRFVVADTGTCTGRVLQPQANCQFRVNYNAAFNAERPRIALVRIHWERPALEAFIQAL